jgi:hypothetical protein
MTDFDHAGQSRNHIRADRLKLSVLNLIVLPALAAMPRVPTRSVNDHGCGVPHWTSAKRINQPGTNRVARFPSIGGYGDQFYVVGNNIPFFDRSPVPVRPLTIWDMRAGGSLVEPPAGIYSFVFPKAVVDSKRRLHLFWGESSPPQPPEAFRWGSAPISSIWWATYSPESGWAVPQRVLTGPRVDWDPTTPSDAIIGEDGDIMFALPSDGRTGERTLFHTNHNRWWTTPIPASGSYMSLAANGRHLFFAYTDAAQTLTADVNSVFLLESTDRGLSWMPPVLVSRSGARGAYELHGVALHDGSLHLLWVQDVGNNSSVIRHVVRRFGSSSWSAPRDLPINAQAGTASLAVAPDSCQRIQIVYQDWRKGPEDRRLVHAYFKADWSAPRNLSPEFRVSEATLGSGRGGEPMLVFLAQQVASKNSSPIWMMYSRATGSPFTAPIAPPPASPRPVVTAPSPASASIASRSASKPV